jgi:hypothetical protein
MLRVTTTNVMGRLRVSVYCTAHSPGIPHLLWSASVTVGAERPEDELRSLVDGLSRCLRAWEQGEFDFTDDCFDILPGSLGRRWNTNADD